MEATVSQKMPDAVKPELLRSLGRVVRGLSALFWGLPLTLIVYVQTANTDWLEFFGPFAMLPPMVASGMLLYGLTRMGSFQKQERIWHQALYRAQILAVIDIGLAPFLFWWHRLPSLPFYSMCVGLLTLSSILFLINLNTVLRRLTAMLPDETLRSETNLFTTFNYCLLAAVFFILTAYFILQQVDSLPRFMEKLIGTMKTQGLWMILFLILMPIAMTMAMIWKIKELIFTSVIEARA